MTRSVVICSFLPPPEGKQITDKGDYSEESMVGAFFKILRDRLIGRSPDFGSGNLGSNPSPGIMKCPNCHKEMEPSHGSTSEEGDTIDYYVWCPGCNLESLIVENGRYLKNPKVRPIVPFAITKPRSSNG